MRSDYRKHAERRAAQACGICAGTGLTEAYQSENNFRQTLCPFIHDTRHSPAVMMLAAARVEREQCALAVCRFCRDPTFPAARLVAGEWVHQEGLALGTPCEAAIIRKRDEKP